MHFVLLALLYCSFARNSVHSSLALIPCLHMWGLIDTNVGLWPLLLFSVTFIVRKHAMHAHRDIV